MHRIWQYLWMISLKVHIRNNVISSLQIDVHVSVCTRARACVCMRMCVQYMHAIISVQYTYHNHLLFTTKPVGKNLTEHQAVEVPASSDEELNL